MVTSPDKWIYEQARDGFKGEWQAAGGQPRPVPERVCDEADLRRVNAVLEREFGIGRS